MAKESKYVNIYRILKQKIEDGELKSGEKMYSESQLMEMYGVSRDTVRKSLNLLEQNRYIQKAQGKAAVVMPREAFVFPISEIASFQEVNQLTNMKAKTKVVNLDIIQNTEICRTAFGKTYDGEVYELVRVRKINGEGIILDKDYFDRSIVPRLPLSACQQSVYNYLENEMGLQIGYATKEITVQMASEEDRELLDLKQFDMVIVIKSYTYLTDNTLFQYTESRHRPDKFRFVDLARRKL